MGGNRAKSKSPSNDRSEDDGKQSAAFGSFEAASSAKHKGPIFAMCHVRTSIAGPGARESSVAQNVNILRSRGLMMTTMKIGCLFFFGRVARRSSRYGRDAGYVRTL